MGKIIINGICYESLPCKEEDWLCNCCDLKDITIMCDEGRCPACDIVDAANNRLFVEMGKVEEIKFVEK
ncbi:hypothetical protein [Bacteroides sp. 224]|uniref:hypothetical protein n=1 Tax=Bacteroides sp. 224 TaxID=2302936 RepID=UPI0013D6A6CD|nr:hypothetical protein [Bacteroides sp. 224]NDV63897.1 hypothetical protein [Bacteroides sp. 224]